MGKAQGHRMDIRHPRCLRAGIHRLVRKRALVNRAIAVEQRAEDILNADHR
jgi:hypothetical protein